MEILFFISSFMVVFMPSYAQIERRNATDLTIDQIILSIYGDNENVGKFIQLPNEGKMAELDMVLTPEQYDNLYPKNNSRTKRKAYGDLSTRWPNAIMPYVFNGNDFSSYDKYFIKVSMREWEKYTCVRFREKLPTDRNYVQFQDGFGCNSQLGMSPDQNGRQILNLDSSGCRWKGLYLHEIGHAIGLIHEHQRPIRDNWISIVRENVDPSMLIWFQKYPNNQVASHKVEYEYSSVMHYGITAFSKRDANNQPLQTIRAKYTNREKEIGRVYQKELSFTDVKIVNLMYDCNRHCDSSKKCLGEGYLDQHCECVCPDGTSDCEEGKPAPPASCTNTGGDWGCSIWAKQGECNRNKAYMHTRCRKACGLCHQTPDPLDGRCDDVFEREFCEKWKTNGDCIVNQDWMRQNCRLTCGLCDPDKAPPGTQCSNKYFNDSKCDEWALSGECQINPRWMPDNCRKSCRLCPLSDNPDPPTTGRVSTTTRKSIVLPRLTTTAEVPTTAKFYNSPSTTAKPMGQCKNRYNDEDCDLWARHNHCAINPSFMEVNCMLSCDTCRPGSTYGATSTTERPGTRSPLRTTVRTVETATDMMSNCKNEYHDDALCDAWAAAQHCVINSPWMKTFCMKSCRVCTPELRRVARSEGIRSGYMDEDGRYYMDGKPKDNSSASLLGSVITVMFSLLLTLFK